MALTYHPKRGSVLLADFDQGFKKPEMVKKRLCVVVSTKFKERVGLCTIVPLSTSAPKTVMPYNCKLDIPFEIPMPWGNCTRWVKADMICAVGFHRLNLLRKGKDQTGKRLYVLETLANEQMDEISACILASIGLGL